MTKEFNFTQKAKAVFDRLDAVDDDACFRQTDTAIDRCLAEMSLSTNAVDKLAAELFRSE